MNEKQLKIYTELNQIAVQKGGHLTSNYVSGTTEISLKCGKNHEFKLLPSMIKRGDWCEKCTPKGEKIEIICNMLNEMDIQYKNNFRIPMPDNYIFDLCINHSILIDFDLNEVFQSYELQGAIKLKIISAKKHNFKVVRIDETILENRDKLEDFITSCLLSHQDIMTSNNERYNWLSENKLKILPAANLASQPAETKISEEKIPENTGIIVGYCRVSTQEQVTKGISLDTQAEKIRQYAEFKNMHVREIYVDAGISGKNIEDRPALVRLLNEIRKKETLIVISLSRLIRNIKQAISIDELLKKKGAYLVALDLDINTRTAVGRLIFQVFNSLNEFERAQTAERISLNLTHKAEQGRLQSKAPYGWKIGESEKFERVESEQYVIQSIRKWKTENPKLTIANIKKKLNEEEDYVSRLRKAKKWYHNQVKNIMIQNLIYDEETDRSNRAIQPSIRSMIQAPVFTIINPSTVTSPAPQARPETLPEQKLG